MTRTDSTGRYVEVLQAEARDAEEASDAEAAARLRALAESAEDMTPAEETWAREASEQELRAFARALRSGCPPDQAR